MTNEDVYDRPLALWYETECAPLRAPSGDLGFYAGLARRDGGPVLELGCGTGRAILPIAAEGIACVGLDLSPAMLDLLRAKGPPPNLTLVEGSMTGFDLGEGRFKLIFSAFRGLQHLYTVEEQLAALTCVRRHLAPGGVFAFDVFAPPAGGVGILHEPEQESARVPEGDGEIRRHVSASRDGATQMLRIRFRNEHWRAGARVSEEITETRMRWFHPFELEHLLARAGFAVTAMYNGFDERPYDGTGEIVVVAGAAG